MLQVNQDFCASTSMNVLTIIFDIIDIHLFE